MGRITGGGLKYKRESPLLADMLSEEGYQYVMLWYAIARQNSNFFDVVNNNKRDSGNTLTRRLARYSSGQCRHMPCYIHVDVWASSLFFYFIFSALAHLDNNHF